MSVAALAICALTSIFISSSYASSTHRSSPRPTSAPMKHTLSAFAAPTGSFNGSTCSKADATAHTPPKVGYPDTNVALVDHIFILNTNCGQIAFKSWGKKAPTTVIAMTFLAKNGYFDHTFCHRVTTASIYVLQCGDPTASGSGGPQWQYRDENLPDEESHDYPAGTVAMANSGANTNGSQFFIVYKDSTLPPSYTIWGTVTKGLDIVKKVAAQGVVGGGTDGWPKQSISIDSVIVK